MATASIAARAGVIAFSTSTSASITDGLGEVRNIRFRVVHDQIDATSNDSSGWNESIRGSRGFSGTCESLYYSSSGSAARSFANAVEQDIPLAFRFYPTTAASATHNYSGIVHISDFEIGGDTAGLHMNNVSFVGTGAFSFTTST